MKAADSLQPTACSQVAMMALLVVGGLFGAGVSRAGSVEVLSCEAAAQRAHVAVDLSGRAAGDVKVELRTPEYRLVETLKIDGSGRVLLPRLKTGRYIVTALGPNRVGGSICVDVGKGSAEANSSFTIAMKTLPAMAGPVVLAKERVERFEGTLVDPTGAGVAGAEIVIVSAGSLGASRRRIVKTGKDGGFSAGLAGGNYTASFASAGFRQVVMEFEVVRGGSSEGLRVVLPVGEVSQ